LWNLSFDYAYLPMVVKSEINIPTSWKTMTIAWNGTTVDITVTP
jgi:hypothetical protein